MHLALRRFVIGVRGYNIFTRSQQSGILKAPCATCAILRGSSKQLPKRSYTLRSREPSSLGAVMVRCLSPSSNIYTTWSGPACIATADSQVPLPPTMSSSGLYHACEMPRITCLRWLRKRVESIEQRCCAKLRRIVQPQRGSTYADMLKDHILPRHG